jgi:hypothetical protein
MTNKVNIEISDDTDGSRADQTVPFGLDGVSYEIDLTAAHDVRSWARDHGYDVRNRGRIPASVVDAHKKSRDKYPAKTTRKPRIRSKSEQGPKRGK